MKKFFIPFLVLIIAVVALSVYAATYDTGTPAVVVREQSAAQSIASSSADLYAKNRTDYPVGKNTENQYDILAKNKLYGHNDYGDYVPAKVRYVDGFATVDGKKTYSRYYEDKKYVQPPEEEKDREDWNLYDFHDHGELLESEGNGSYIDPNAVSKAISDSGMSIDDLQNLVNNVNANQQASLDAGQE